MIQDVGKHRIVWVARNGTHNEVHSMPITLEHRHRLLHMRAFLAERTAPEAWTSGNTSYSAGKCWPTTFCTMRQASDPPRRGSSRHPSSTDPRRHSKRRSAALNDHVIPRRLAGSTPTPMEVDALTLPRRKAKAAEEASRRQYGPDLPRVRQAGTPREGLLEPTGVVRRKADSKASGKGKGQRQSGGKGNGQSEQCLRGALRRRSTARIPRPWGLSVVHNREFALVDSGAACHVCVRRTGPTAWVLGTSSVNRRSTNNLGSSRHRRGCAWPGTTAGRARRTTGGARRQRRWRATSWHTSPLRHGAKLAWRVEVARHHIRISEGSMLDFVLPVIQYDYGHLTGHGRRTGGRRSSTNLFATLRTTKGPIDTYAVAAFASWVWELDHARLIIQSDGEPAILAVVPVVRDKVIADGKAEQITC